MATVKVFADGRTDGRTDRRTDGQTDGQSDYYRAPHFQCGGPKNDKNTCRIFKLLSFNKKYHKLCFRGHV